MPIANHYDKSSFASFTVDATVKLAEEQYICTDIPLLPYRRMPLIPLHFFMF